MFKFLRLSTAAVVASILVVSLLWAMGTAAADGPENLTAKNLTAEDVRELLEQDPGEVTGETRQAVSEWVDENAMRLTTSEIEESQIWVRGEVPGDDLDDDSGDDLADELDPFEAENVTCERTIDGGTCVTDWSYADGTFTITFWSDSEERVGIQEASDWDEDAQRFAYSEEYLEAGETTVTFTVFERSGAAVGIMSETARENEQGGAILSTGRVADDPFKSFGGTSGLFSGIGMSVLLSAVAALYVVKTEESGVIEA